MGGDGRGGGGGTVLNPANSLFKLSDGKRIVFRGYQIYSRYFIGINKTFLSFFF